MTQTTPTQTPTAPAKAKGPKWSHDSAAELKARLAKREADAAELRAEIARREKAAADRRKSMKTERAARGERLRLLGLAAEALAADANCDPKHRRAFAKAMERAFSTAHGAKGSPQQRGKHEADRKKLCEALGIEYTPKEPTQPATAPTPPADAAPPEAGETTAAPQDAPDATAQSAATRPEPETPETAA